jgi:hypothetical protein
MGKHCLPIQIVCFRLEKGFIGHIIWDLAFGYERKRVLGGSKRV